MFPGGHIVARPNRRETLYARIPRPGYGERALIFHDGAQPFVSSAYHLHTVNIMCLTVRATVTVVLVPYIVGESACAKYSGLVHIVPYPCNAHLYQLVKQSAPPGAYFGIGKVGKLATARPYMALHKIIVAAAAEVAIVLAFFKHRIVIVNPYPGINDHNGFEAVGRQFFDHLFGVGKVLAIPGKAPVTVHIVNVEIDPVAGYFVLPEAFGDLFYFRFRIVAPAALVVPERPK